MSAPNKETLAKRVFSSLAQTPSLPVVSLELVNDKFRVHPKQFKIQVTPGKKQVIKVGRSTEQSDMVLKADVSNDLLTVSCLLYKHTISRKCGAMLVLLLQISRMHAVIYKNSRNEWVLVDKGSRNGCFANGLKTLQHKLSHGDTIVFGGGGGLKLGSYKSKIDSKFAYQFFNPDTAVNENGMATHTCVFVARCYCVCAYSHS